MHRSTRTGRVFSPYTVDPALFTNVPQPEISHTAVDLEPYLHTALARADRRAAAYDGGLVFDLALPPDLDTEPGEWEDEDDEVDSRAPLPLSELSATPPPSRSPSPVNLQPASHSDLDGKSPGAAQDSDVEAALDPHMPLLVPTTIHTRCAQAAAYARRRRKRAAAIQVQPPNPFHRRIRAKHSQDHRQLPPERTSFEPASSYTLKAGAWVGGRGRARPRRRWTLKALEEVGTRHVKWDGRSPKLILDVHGRIIAILLGRPEDAEWDSVVDDACKAMRRARRAGHASGGIRAKDTKHHRGHFVALASGVSFGGGQKVHTSCS
ncbi:hypothetical protein FB451DRAFT_1419783 [Mycena latifolia]|nr:hypothetical protein FB451DRAFT_1419783 [Mycena latifolia]